MVISSEQVSSLSAGQLLPAQDAATKSALNAIVLTREQAKCAQAWAVRLAVGLCFALSLVPPTTAKGQSSSAVKPANIADANSLELTPSTRSEDLVEVVADDAALVAPGVETSRERGFVTVSKASVLVGSLTVFLLAVFVGFEIITKVPPTLHTPLMSGSNAISGITVVGAMLAAGSALGGFGSLLGLLAVVLATVNVVGGFLVTHRMLMMFKKR